MDKLLKCFVPAILLVSCSVAGAVSAQEKIPTFDQQYEVEVRKGIHDYVAGRFARIPELDMRMIPPKYLKLEGYLPYVQNKHDREQEVILDKSHEELEALAEGFRKSQARTPSGVWKLRLFYDDAKYWDNSVYVDKWDLHYKGLKRWVTKYPDSPTPHLILANAFLKRAWAYRGGGYAKDVSPEDWQPFRENISQARKYLEDTKSIASKDPNWYVLMLDVATYQGWPFADFLNLMEEATSAYPYYYTIYFTGLNYLSPRWYGNKDKIEAFINYAVEKTRAKEKTTMYARLYWAASQSYYRHRLFIDSAADWGKMRQGIFDLIENYPDQWNLNHLAYFACLAKDKSTAKTLIEKITKPIERAWEAVEVYESCRSWANGDSAEAF